MALTNDEKETIIQYCDADKMATVYTCNNALMNKLDKQENYRVIREYKHEGKIIAKEYAFDKKLITLRTKRITRELTEEQKKEIAERLKRGRE